MEVLLIGLSIPENSSGGLICYSNLRIELTKQSRQILNGFKSTSTMINSSLSPKPGAIPIFAEKHKKLIIAIFKKSAKYNGKESRIIYTAESTKKTA